MTGAVPSPEPGLGAAPTVAAAPTASAANSGPVDVAPRPHRPRRRRWVRVLRIIALAIALPIVAFAIGLLVSWIGHLIRSDGTGSRARAPAAGQLPSRAPSRAASAPAAPRVVVPADWVTEVAPPAGLTYRHPPGWIRRTSHPEVLRFAPSRPGSTAPGVEGVGAGFESNPDPAQAARDFGARVYGGQPGFAATAPAAVSPTAAGGHPGEQQSIVTYNRSRVPVRVVVHCFRSGTRTVLVLGRAGNAQPARAAQLEATVEASLQLSG